RWRRILSPSSEMELQVSYGRTDRRDVLLGEARDTVQVDFQHRFTLSPRHEILWGLGYEFTTDQIDGTAIATLNPDQRGTHLYSAFAQDEVTLAPDRLRLALGSKFERNDYTGFEVQPSARLLWTPYQRHGFWVSVARAVQTPSRGYQDGRLNLAAFPGPNGLPVLAAFVGNRRLGSVDLLAYELGYRLQPTGRFSLDLASFYNVYTNLVSIALDTPFPEAAPAPLHVVVPAHLENLGHGRTHGVEITGHWNPAERWKLSAGYTGFAGPPPSSPSTLPGLGTAQGGGESPGQQVHFRSYLDLTPSLQFDTALYYVGSLPALGIPSYTRLDARLGWRVTPELDLSLGLQNLLDDRHPEFISEILTRQTEIGRSVYGRVTWRF
ncbi:MAG TPA: TonB-dependent receptor, partial [Bryobacterales bacterium]|nr:TonB-dependent receptor [Bryobacterales bacterium]